MKITRIPQVVPPPDLVQIEMTLEEAGILMALVGAVSGRSNIMSNLALDIFCKLRDIGVEKTTKQFNYYSKGCSKFFWVEEE